MGKYLTIFLAMHCILFSAQANNTVYQWVDAQGVTHFSDQPQAGATQLEVNPVPPATQGPLVSPRAAVKKAEKTIKYQLNISQPLNEQTIRDNQGKITIKAATSPAPNNSMSYKLVLDQLPQGQLSKQAHFQLTNIDRGAHTIQVQLVDSSGKLIASSETITIFLHRAKTSDSVSTTAGGS
ncbi:DUF4124 domain-containing protein [Agarivorans sp. Z349TD_8]|uniref:DUF4124 domain-containing protein n=1 Tax=Agarivorans sp. Z349TD_8 TaxID=3421434 RepID=UPI003D7EFD71